MGKTRSLLIVAALVGLPATALAADPFKQAPPTVTPPQPTVTLSVANVPTDFDLPTDKNVIFYCLGGTTSLSGGGVVTIQEMKRTTDGWRYDPPYQAPATNEWANCQPGDAKVIDPTVINPGS